VRAQVNERVGATERDGRSGDPKFPKKLWPPAELCAECHAPEGGSSRWNEAEVLRFLQHFYQVTRPRSSGSRKHLGTLEGVALATSRYAMYTGSFASTALSSTGVLMGLAWW